MSSNDIVDGNSVIIAEVPLAETFGYATDLRSMTQGQGTFTMELATYRETPSNVARRNHRDETQGKGSQEIGFSVPSQRRAHFAMGRMRQGFSSQLSANHDSTKNAPRDFGHAGVFGFDFLCSVFFLDFAAIGDRDRQSCRAAAGFQAIRLV